MANTNYAQWKLLHYMWDSVQDFKARWNGFAGVHTIAFADNQPSIDIYVNEFVAEQKHSTQTVFFTGAVSNRNGKKGPFFSGLGICFNSKLPLIAIADPTLDNDMEIGLGWYLGGPNDSYENNLHNLLVAVQEVLSRELIFVGGSGGGFAALNFARRFSGDCSVLVWNPQTDIYEYSERFVKAFLKSRFGFAHASLAKQDWKEFCKIRTDGRISTDVLEARTLTNPRRLIYLQNKSDWHRQSHLAPLWKLHMEDPIVDGTNRIDENHLIIVDEFAEGHAPPSSKLIASILRQLMDPLKTVETIVFAESVEA